MTRGTICEFCKKFFPNDKYGNIDKDIYSIKKNHRAKVKHVCKKCFKKKLYGRKNDN